MDIANLLPLFKVPAPAAQINNGVINNFFLHSQSKVKLITAYEVEDQNTTMYLRRANTTTAKDVLSFAPGALVVSFEQTEALYATNGLLNQVPPTVWPSLGIVHMNLNNDSNEALLLIILEMSKAWAEGRDIYLLGKNPTSLYALAAFGALSTLNATPDISNDDIIAKVKAELETILGKKQNKLNMVLLNLNDDQEQQLKSLLDFCRDVANNNNSSYRKWFSILQSTEYKLFLADVYRHPELIPSANNYLSSLHEAATKEINISENVSELVDVSIKDDFEPLKTRNAFTNLQKFIADNLHATNDSMENSDVMRMANAQLQFLEACEAYKKRHPKFNHEGFDGAAMHLRTSMMLSPATLKKKVEWLETTSKFINHPDQHAAEYFKQASEALMDNQSILQQRMANDLFIIGLILLASAVLVAALVATNIFGMAAAIVLTVAAVSLLVGSEIISPYPSSQQVAEASTMLHNEISVIKEPPLSYAV